MAGSISIAHPVFFALGAYTSAILARDFGVPVLLAMLAGMLVAVVASIALALPSLRVSGDYLLIASIGFQLGMLEVIKNLRFTGGAGGFTNIPPFLIRDFGRESYVLLVLAVMLGVIVVGVVDQPRRLWPRHERDARRRTRLRVARARRDVDEDRDLRFRLRHCRVRRRALRALFPLRRARAVRNPAVLRDPDDGRGRRHAHHLGAGRRRAAAAGAAAGDHLPAICRRACSARCRACCSPGWCWSSCSVRPQGLVPAKDIWRAVPRAKAAEAR